MRRSVWQSLLILSFIIILVGLLTWPYSTYFGYVALLGFGMLIVVAFRPYEKPTSFPVGSISVSSAIGVYLFSAAFFAFLAFSATTYLYPVNYAGAGLFLLVAGTQLYYSFRLWQLPTRRVEFYDDHFEVTGRGTNSLVRYADVFEVSKVKGFSFWSSSTRVRLKLRNQDEILLPGNPTQRNLKSDLYTWITTKAGLG